MGTIFKRGMVAIAPLAITLALILWLFNALEATFKPPVEALIGQENYFAGLGILVAFVLIFIVGSVLNSWIIQRLSAAGNALLKKIPLVKTVYNALVEVMSYFGSKEVQKDEQVVAVEINGMKLIGLVTRTSFEETPEGIGSSGDIAVYLPMSYQIGGYTVILPREKVVPLAMTVEEGLRFAVTAGVLAHPSAKKN